MELMEFCEKSGLCKEIQPYQKDMLRRCCEAAERGDRIIINHRRQGLATIAKQYEKAKLLKNKETV